MRYTPEEVAELLKDKPHQPHYIAAMVRKAIEADREGRVMEWQPIETAPKDGRHMILLLTPSRFPQVAFSNTWWTAGFSVECKPTHWLPIPAPPGGSDA